MKGQGEKKRERIQEEKKCNLGHSCIMKRMCGNVEERGEEKSL